MSAGCQFSLLDTDTCVNLPEPRLATTESDCQVRVIHHIVENCRAIVGSTAKEGK
jgi:hypothetical protein